MHVCASLTKHLWAIKVQPTVRGALVRMAAHTGRHSSCPVDGLPWCLRSVPLKQRLRQRPEWVGLIEGGLSREGKREQQERAEEEGTQGCGLSRNLVLGGCGVWTVPQGWSHLEARDIGWSFEPLCHSDVGCRLPTPEWGLRGMAGAALAWWRAVLQEAALSH